MLPVEVPKSYIIELRNKTIFPASYAAINSASAEEPATVGCNFVLYPTAPPAMLTLTPVVDRRVLRQAAQLESADDWRMNDIGR
jgi:hypothetical protein